MRLDFKEEKCLFKLYHIYSHKIQIFDKVQKKWTLYPRILNYLHTLYTNDASQIFKSDTNLNIDIINTFNALYIVLQLLDLVDTSF